MIPSIGEKVKINPEFIKEVTDRGWLATGNWLGRMEDVSRQDIELFVISIESGSDIITIGLGEPLNQEISVWEESGAYFLFGTKSSSVLLPVIPIVDLRILNTKLGATICAACGGILKDPGMGPMFKYCPKCEP